MRVSMQSTDQHLAQLSSEIKQLTAVFESKNGTVQTTDILRRDNGKTVWNGALKLNSVAKKARSAKSAINQQVTLHYATAPCLKELAKELGITVNSLFKRAGRLGIGRDEASKLDNHPSTLRAAQRLNKTAELLEAGQPLEAIAEKLDITPRQVRQYRQQIESMQEAA